MRRAAVAGTDAPQLHLLVRAPDQLEAALEVFPASITLDYLDLYGLRPSIERVKSSGLSRLTPTHDLNAEQVANLAREAGAENIEAVPYQHLPVLHTEHCVFCRFLSSGASYRDRGRPCERHRVALKDPAGRAHPVMADVGCRNTVFGAEAQEAWSHLEDWRTAGVRHFRLEFVHESGGEVRKVFRAFQSALGKRMTPAQLGAELKRVAPAGTTEGSLFVGRSISRCPFSSSGPNEAWKPLPCRGPS